MKNSPKLDLFNNFLFHVCQVNDVDRHKDKSSHGFLSSLRRGHHWHWYPYKSSGGWESKSIAFLSCTVWPRSIEFGSFCSWKIPFYSAFAFFFFFLSQSASLFFCHLNYCYSEASRMVARAVVVENSRHHVILNLCFVYHVFWIGAFTKQSPVSKTTLIFTGKNIIWRRDVQGLIDLAHATV